MNINGLNILFDNGDNIFLKKEECIDFYITNLTNKGIEVAYDKTIIKNKLYANFCLLKLLKTSSIIKVNRLKEKRDICEIDVIMHNNKLIKFDIASDADPFLDVYDNNYEYIYEDDLYLGIILSKYNIKYKENLFI